MAPQTPPHVAFVLEQALGHVTHAQTLHRLLATQRLVDAEIFDVEWDVRGWAARVPVYRSNWTVRAGLRARQGIRRMHKARPLDAMFVHTQVPAVLNPDWVARIPTVVSLDATPLQYDALGEHYDHRRGQPRVEHLKWRANQRCFERAAHVVAWSSWAKHGVVEGYGIDEAKVSVIPPGVDPAEWERPARDHVDGPVRILFVGGDLARKGGGTLIEAFRSLRDECHGDVALDVVTRTDLEPEPGITVHRGLGSGDPALVECFHRADIFCLPTKADCLPMVLSEAGAAGLPLVSTAVAGIPEILRDGETGLVVDPDDPSSVARALRTLVTDRELRQRLGAGARRVVVREFDATRNMGRLVELLAAVARPGGPS